MTDTDLSNHLRPELDEALLALDETCNDNPDDALAVFESLPEAVQALPDFQLALARTYQAKGQLDAARDVAANILPHPEHGADAHHFLGDVLEDLGQLEEANEHFLKTLELDQFAFRDEGVDPAALCERLQSVLQRIVTELPAEIAPSVGAARLEVRLFPTREEVLEGTDPRSFLHFQGEPRSDSARLVLYAANLHAEFGDLEEFDEFVPQVTACIHQELALFLELSEPESRRLGLLPPD